MFPTSTHKGQAVLGFPDVCKTPAPVAAPVPIAYPNIGTTSVGVKTPYATKTTATKTAYTNTSGDAAGLRSHLGILHQKLMSMPGGNATGWHAVLDEYVMTSADLFKVLSDNR